MTQRRNEAERLRALMDRLADDAEALSDEKVLADAQARGVDVSAEADRIRGVLLAGAIKAKKRRLAAAEAAYRQATDTLARSVSSLPSTPQARRALLDRTFQRKPQTREAVVTLQHRNLEAFTDDDVESVLRQLEHLGLLGDDDDKSIS